MTQLLNGSVQISDASVCAVAGITAEELAKAREIERSLSAPQDMMARMKAIQASGMKHPAGIPKSGAKHPSWIPKIGKRPESAGLGNGEKTPERPVTEMPAMMMPGVKEYTKEEKEFARLIMEIERTVRNVGNYRSALERSPETEFASILNAMAGGYTTPSPGGDPIANPKDRKSTRLNSSHWS